MKLAVRKMVANNAQGTVSSASEQVQAPGQLMQAAQIGIFTGAIFTGAALIFLIQPMVAKMALPLFGGSPAVWNTSMVLFQALLLAGYAYAHLSTRMLGIRQQSLLHLGVLLLPLLALPIQLRIDRAQPDGTSPTLWLLLVLLLTAGLPFLVVSTASPTLQRWFSSVNNPSASDPYFLYAASNAGSLIALIAYPVIIEPNLTLAEQGQVWTAVYLLFLGLCAASAFMLHRYPRPEACVIETAAVATPAISAKTRVGWVWRAFIPSSLMVGVTGYLSTDVASIPFLWVLPLSIYLLTFILAFGSKQLISIRVASAVLVVSVVASIIQAIQWQGMPVAGVVVIHLVLLFAAGILAHSQLAHQRPATSHLTEFYLLLSVGGVLGGAFNALIAPVVFDSMLEYPIVIVLALLLRPGSHRTPGGPRLPWMLDFFLPLAAVFTLVISIAIVGVQPLILIAAGLSPILFAKRPVRFAVMAAMLLAIVPAGAYSALHAERTFFGVLKVTESDSNRHVLAHGTTIHGIQDLSSTTSRAEPLSYYSRSGPIGQVFDDMRQRETLSDVAVVGLGAGSLAAYGEQGQTFSFFEIDPAVVRIASDPKYFTYLDDTAADLRMIVGDGRLRLQEETNGRYDLIVMDAFSSDSVPVHLLTVEAVQLYFEKLAPDGVIAMHISNRNLEMEPVIAAIADQLQLTGLGQSDVTITQEELDAGYSPSHWVVLARTPYALGGLAHDSRWKPLEASDGSKAWTDDFSNILSTVKWLR